MVERWRTEDLQRLLINKHLVIIGDSIQRGLYKDLVRLLQTNEYLAKDMLKRKGEKSFQGDQLIEGGQHGVMHNGKNYREVRQYHTAYHVVTFYMVTACYSSYVETVLEDLMQEPRPDIIFMSSCLWDITRNGPNGRVKYQKNLQHLAKRLKLVLKEDALFVWNAATPVSQFVRGGFMLEEIYFMNQTLRHDVLEANFYAKQVMVDYGHNVLDLHFHFRHWLHLREKDGIHWNMYGHRKMTNLVLDHLSHSLGFPLPRNMWKNDDIIINQRVASTPTNRCQQCNMDFPTALARIQHMETAHSKQRRNTLPEPLVCPSFEPVMTACNICKATGKNTKLFCSMTALQQHQEAKHPHQEEKHPHRGQKRKRGMGAITLSLVGPDEFGHLCMECRVALKSPAMIAHHQQITGHAGVRPVIICACGVAFRLKTSLEGHQNLVCDPCALRLCPQSGHETKCLWFFKKYASILSGTICSSIALVKTDLESSGHHF